MLLSYMELLSLVQNGVLKNVEHDFINAASIDITLGSKILVEEVDRDSIISLRDRTPMNMREVDVTDGYYLNPGEFILAQSEQVFNLPNNISAEYKMKSSMARIGMNHALAGWCDAGWHGSVLTLELMNVSTAHSIFIQKGDRIGQMVFFKHTEVPKDRSYAARGRYNGDTEVQGVKE